MMDETPLPGMESATVRGDGPVTAAARRTITALGPVLDESHAVMCAALVTTAQQLDRAAASNKAKDYGVANLVAQLRETWHALTPDTTDGGGNNDAWDDLAAELRSAAVIRDFT